MKNIFLHYPGLAFFLLAQVSCGPQGQEEGFLDEGKALMTEGEVEQAVELFSKALAEKEPPVEVFSERGKAYLQL